MVNMGGDNCLKALTQKSPGKLNAKRLRLFRCDFTRGKGVDDMIALYAVFLIPAFLSSNHFIMCLLREAVNTGYKFLLLSLFRVQYIADRVI